MTFVISSIIGWGLVINQFAAEAPWNNWQGYFLGPLGGKDGDWAYSNLGVIVALVLSFVVTFLARRPIVRAQEARARTLQQQADQHDGEPHPNLSA